MSKTIDKDKLTPTAFARRVTAYFRECDSEIVSPACASCTKDEASCALCPKRRTKPYTLSGLCLALGITKRQFKALKANKCFCNDVELALLKIEAYIEENSISGGINGALATAILKENFGWGAKDDSEEGKIEISLSGEADKYAG